jgi:hypothetical protein
VSSPLHAQRFGHRAQGRAADGGGDPATIFAQPEQATAHEAVERICRLFAKRYPQLVKVLQEAETDILAFYSFPAATAAEEHPYEMTVDLSVLESLGINLYSNAAAVLTETGRQRPRRRCDAGQDQLET